MYLITTIESLFYDLWHSQIKNKIVKTFTLLPTEHYTQIYNKMSGIL